MSHMGNVGFQWKFGASRATKSPGFLLWFAYDERTVERLKELVPAYARCYYPDNSSWWVAVGWAAAIEEMWPGFGVGVAASRRFPMFEEPPEEGTWT